MMRKSGIRFSEQIMLKQVLPIRKILGDDASSSYLQAE